ncbi:unnamed protein product [Paramecium sonneborni]|uniref:Uncharacterized protein n=1 Tax=Paramecium sonneborni TaxID=65129 RepID=A0A8S1KG44_9CILI|nr:unnamed protein product [Paramecium sonneborni]
MQKKRLSSVDQNFMSSLRKYEEHPTQKQMNAQKKETQQQEQQLLIQDIQANISDLEDGNYMKCFTSINLMFTDPKYLLRKHITFQLFVPEERDFIGFTILNKKEIWILLLLYFDIVNQDKNQYARYLWQSIIKKMTEYLNYELREEVMNKVKIYREKSKLTNNLNKKTNKDSNKYYFKEEHNDKTNEGNEINNSYKEICFDKSYMATLSDNSINERSQCQEQNIIIMQDHIDLANNNDDVYNQGPNNSSIDLNNDFVEITYHNSNLNDFQIPDISFQQQSQTEDNIKNSIDQISNQVEVSLIAQMEQLGLQENQQSDQLNNAVIVDNEEEILESCQNFKLDQISQTSLENIKIQESSKYKQNFQEENKMTEFLQDNKINQINKQICILDFDQVNNDYNSNSDQFCNKFQQIGDTPHFSINQQSLNLSIKEIQKDQIQQEEQKQNNDMQFQNYEQQIAYDQAKQILKEDLEQLAIDSDNNDQIETKQPEYENKENLSKIEESDIVNIEIKQCSQKVNSKQETNQDCYKTKNQKEFDYTNSLNEEDCKQEEIENASQNQKRRKSRISKLMQKSNANSQLDIAFEYDLSSQQPSKQQHQQELSQEPESQQLSNNKKRRSSNFDIRYDQNFMDTHGSGYRFEILKAPKRLKEKYQVEEILVPKRSSKRIQYPNRSDLEISKMIIANNEILNYFTPADSQSKKISEEINNRPNPITYFNSLNKIDKNQIILLINNQEHFINDIVEIEICLANINDNQSHHIVRILSGQLNCQIAIAQIKKQNSEQIIFEDFNFYNNYLHYHLQQQQAIYLPLGSYLINQN